MPLLPALFISALLWFIFPNAFKHFVGTWMGFCCAAAIYGIVGVMCFNVEDATYNQIFNLHTFLIAVVMGVIAGNVIAAKG